VCEIQTGTIDLTAGRQLVAKGGTVTWSGTGQIRLAAGATIQNEGATWLLQSDAGFINLGAAGSFINHAAGTFRKTAGTGVTSFGVVFDNDGVCEIQTGTIDLTAGGTAAGSFVGSPGSTLRWSGGSYLLTDASSVTAPTVSLTFGNLDVHGSFAAATATSVTGGAMTLHPDASVGALGAVSISTGTLTLDSGDPVSVDTLSLASNGTLQGSDTLSVAGATTWTAGVMTGSGITNANAGVALSTNGTKELSGTRRLNTGGSSTWDGAGANRLATGAVIHNTGTWNAQSDATMSRLNASGGLFENAAGGIFRKTAGAGTSAFQFPFTNAGSVRGQTGTLSFADGYVQTAGSITAQGGTITASAPLDIQGGTLGGTSTIGVSVVNGGHLAPGLSPGIVGISGALTGSPASTFDVEIGGLAAGSEHDRAAITGAASLSGTLSVSLVNGFSPNDHDMFTIMTFASSTGEFTTFDLPTLDGGLSWRYHHNPTAIILEALADIDGDGVSNASDCAPIDPTAWALPAEIAGVGFSLNGQTLSWGSLAVQAGPATVYDVMRGLIAQLPTGGGAAETCLTSDTAATQIIDATTPAIGAGFYYLTRGANVCGVGTYGNRSNGAPRVTPICP